MTNIHEQKVLILDFGSQTTQLIARRVREAKVYCEIYPYNIPLEKVRERAREGAFTCWGSHLNTSSNRRGHQGRAYLGANSGDAGIAAR